MEIGLKLKANIIKEYLQGSSLNDLSIKYNIDIESLKKIINEWIHGYFKVYEDDYYLRQITSLMMEKDITIEDLVQGYYYFKLFNDMEKEDVVRFIISLKKLDEEKRRSLIENSLKMLKLNKYSGIDYSEIPSALDRMVARGRELKATIDSYEKEIAEMENKKREIDNELRDLEKEFEKRKREMDILLFMEKSLELKYDEIKNFLSEAKNINFSSRDLMEVSNALKALRERGMGIEQFIRSVDYLDKLMEMGFSISLIKDLEQDLEGRGVNIQKYLREIDDVIEDKMAYEKKVEDLKKEAKSLENQIRSMRNEIKEYFKKVKPKMK